MPFCPAILDAMLAYFTSNHFEIVWSDAPLTSRKTLIINIVEQKFEMATGGLQSVTGAFKLMCDWGKEDRDTFLVLEICACSNANFLKRNIKEMLQFFFIFFFWLFI